MYHGSVEKTSTPFYQLTTMLCAMGSLNDHMRNSNPFSSSPPTR